MKKKIVLLLLAFVFLGMACFGAFRLLKQQREYQAGEESYDALTQYVHLPDTQPVQPQTPSPAASEEVEQPAPGDDTLWPAVDFDALRAVNPDVVGWIYLEGTHINYPIVLGEDNSEYLKKMVDGSYNSAGSIFMDYRNTLDFSDRHTILYGHNMKNNTMFGQLTEYKNQSFYDAHPTCLILTPEGNYKLEFFAGYVADLNGEGWKLAFGDEEEFGDWLERAVDNSTFTSAVTPTAQDRVVTLSTCSYEFDQARYILLGVLVPQ